MENKEKTTNISKKRKASATRKEEILETAFQVFLEKGYTQTKVEEIAKKGGVAKGLVFFYFSTKEDLFKEVLAQYAHFPIKSTINKLLEQNKDLPIREQLPFMLKFLLNFINQNTQIVLLIKLLLTEIHRLPELAAFHNEKLIQPLVELVFSMLREGVKRNELKQENIPQHFQVILAPIFIYIIWNIIFPESSMDPDSYAADCSSFIMRALGIETP